MKKKTFLISIILISTFLSFAQPQLPFIAYENNPILEHGEPGSWDELHLLWSFMYTEDDTCYLYYSSSPDITNEPCSIGLAISTDGYEFDKLDDPVFIADGTGFDAWSVSFSVVIKYNGEYVLFYSGQSNPGSVVASYIGQATATSPEGPWVAQNDFILEAGSSGEWDFGGIAPESVIKTDSGLLMYYSGFSPIQVGLAYFNGNTWVKYDDPLTTGHPYADSDPILKIGLPGSWDDENAALCNVYKIATGLEMFYTGSKLDNWNIGYASSENGIIWEKYPDNPIYSYEDDPFAVSNGYHVAANPTVMINEGQYFMYYDYGLLGPGYISLAKADAMVQIIHVPGDQPTIQAAIDIATHGDTILVEEGTYYENINFNGKAITVASQFIIDGEESHIENTIIDGSQPINPDMASTVLFVSGEDTTSIITGFTITGGSGTPSSWGDGFSGGGIYCAQSGAKIENNNIVDNHCEGGGDFMSGGGIFTDTCYNRSVIIRNNLVSENSCVAIQSATQSVTGGGMSILIDAVITGNTIKNNFVYHGAGGQALGGGIEGYLSKCIIKNNTIKDNIIENTGNSYQPNGCGIYLQQTQEGTIISGNLITGNQGLGYISIGGGIAIWNNEGELVIDNNIIENNDACRGSGLRLGIYGNVVEITNNVIRNNSPSAYNTSFSRGGGIYITEASVDSKSTGRIKYRDTEKNSTTNLILSKNLLNVIANNNILNNSSIDGGGIFVKTAIDNLLAFNNIFQYNSASSQGDAIFLLSNTHMYVYHNNIDPNDISGTGNWEGEGNIFEDPLFAPDGYHLTQGSPCLDAGITSIEIDEEMYYCPDFDIDGQPRPLNQTAEIGVDELLITGIYGGNISQENSELQISPNPTSSDTHIRFTISEQGFTICDLYDISGVKVKQLLNEEKTPGTYDKGINLIDLPNGVYFITLKTNKGTQTTKMIKL